VIYLGAGDLDQQITFQQRAAGQNAHGQASGAWANVAGLVNIRARVDTRPGQDAFGAGQEYTTAPVTFRVRYRTTINERMRIMWRGVAYEMTGPPINIQGANVALDITAVAGTGDGR
jgi:SPP1 family predicted phage head-tail adaptor